MDNFEAGFGTSFDGVDERLALEAAREDQRLVLRLIELRKEKGVSQEELAARLGISQASVSAFERLGNDPRMSTVRRYARALGVLVRHIVNSDTECGDSHYLAHVSSRGMTMQDTAAAIRRGMPTASRAPADWGSVNVERLAGIGSRVSR